MQLTFDCFDNETKTTFIKNINFEPNEKLEYVLKRNFPNDDSGVFGYKEKSGLLLNVDYYFDNDGILHWDQDIKEMTMENILRRYPDINKEINITFNVGGIGDANVVQIVIEMIHNFDVWAYTHPLEFTILMEILKISINYGIEHGRKYIKSKITPFFESIKCRNSSSFEKSILSQKTWTWKKITKALKTDDPIVILTIMMMYNYSFDENTKIFNRNIDPDSNKKQ